jgi:TolA-binding protein
MKKTVWMMFLLALLASTGIAATPREDEKDFLPIETAYNDGLYDEARKAALDFLSKHRDSKRTNAVRILLGQSYLQSNQIPQALQIFDQLSKENQGKASEEALYWMAETYFKSGDFLGAIKSYSEFIEKYPTSSFYPYAKYSKGWALLELKDYDRAITEFEDLVDKFPTHPLAVESRFKIGQSYFEMERYEDVQCAVAFCAGFSHQLPHCQRSLSAGRVLSEHGGVWHRSRSIQKKR